MTNAIGYIADTSKTYKRCQNENIHEAKYHLACFCKCKKNKVDYLHRKQYTSTLHSVCNNKTQCYKTI